MGKINSNAYNAYVFGTMIAVCTCIVWVTYKVLAFHTHEEKGTRLTHETKEVQTLRKRNLHTEHTRHTFHCFSHVDLQSVQGPQYVSTVACLASFLQLAEYFTCMQ